VGLIASYRARSVFVGIWALTDLSMLLVVHEYVQLIPSLSLAAAWALRQAGLELRPLAGPNAPRLVTSLLLLGFGLGLLVATSTRQAAVTVRTWNDRVAPRFSLSPDELVASYVSLAVKRGPIYIWSESAHVYALSEQQPASRYVNIAPLTRIVPGVLERRANLTADLQAHPPELILTLPVEGETRDQALVPMASHRELALLVATCYEPVSDLPDGSGAWRGFRRLELPDCR
jgi:hypothetical protein